MHSNDRPFGQSQRLERAQEILGCGHVGKSWLTCKQFKQEH